MKRIAILVFFLAITALAAGEEGEDSALGQESEAVLSIQAGDIVNWPVLCRGTMDKKAAAPLRALLGEELLKRNAHHRDTEAQRTAGELTGTATGSTARSVASVPSVASVVNPADRESIIKALNTVLAQKDFYTNFAEEDAPTPARVLWNTRELSDKHLARANRVLLESLFRDSILQSLSDAYDMGLVQAAEKHRRRSGLVEALTFCQREIARDPWLRHTRMKCALMLQYSHQNEAAVKELDKLVELLPDFAPALMARARFLLAEGDAAVTEWLKGDDGKRARAVMFAKREAADKAARLRASSGE